MRAAAGAGPACKAVRRFTWFLEAFAIAVTRPKARAFTMFMEPHLSKEAGQQQACRAIEVRYRRISPVLARPGERHLTEPTPAVQPCRGNASSSPETDLGYGSALGSGHSPNSST